MTKRSALKLTTTESTSRRFCRIKSLDFAFGNILKFSLAIVRNLLALFGRILLHDSRSKCVDFWSYSASSTCWLLPNNSQLIVYWHHSPITSQIFRRHTQQNVVPQPVSFTNLWHSRLLILVKTKTIFDHEDKENTPHWCDRFISKNLKICVANTSVYLLTCLTCLQWKIYQCECFVWLALVLRSAKEERARASENQRIIGSLFTAGGAWPVFASPKVQIGIFFNKQTCVMWLFCVGDLRNDRSRNFTQ